jgi:hypothetical protein
LANAVFSLLADSVDADSAEKEFTGTQMANNPTRPKKKPKERKREHRIGCVE